MMLHTANNYKQEFHRRHGGQCYFDDGCYWYEDGAYREENPLGVYCEPPDPTTEEGEFSLLQNKRRFYQAKMKKAVQQFDTLRESLSFSIPEDEDEQLKQLEQMRRVAGKCQEEFRQAQSALDNSRIGRRLKGLKKFEQEQREKIAAWQSKLQKVRL